MATNRRDMLIDTALRLFEERGYQQTGINAILAEAGIAKMTLYNHFRSKDELILAALRRRDETFRNGLMRTVEQQADSPRDRLLAVFDVLGEWCNRPGFRGCMFINAAAEFTDEGCAIRGACDEHKRLFERYLTELAAQASASDPESLAAQLGLLLEGAIVSTQRNGDARHARNARNAAEALIQLAQP